MCGEIMDIISALKNMIDVREGDGVKDVRDMRNHTDEVEDVVNDIRLKWNVKLGGFSLWGVLYDCFFCNLGIKYYYCNVQFIVALQYNQVLFNNNC